MTNEEASYLAGVIDSDGCISVRRQQRKGRSRPIYYQGTISVVNRHWGLLEWIKEITGAKSIHILHDETKSWARDEWCQSYRWQANGRTGRDILIKIKPYLKVKIKQADLYIELYNLKQNVSNSKFKYNKVSDRYDEIVRLIMSYNKKGKEYLINNGMNCWDPKSKDMVISSQVEQACSEGSETTGDDTILSCNTRYSIPLEREDIVHA